MMKPVALAVCAAVFVMLQGCITSVVTVPAKIAYKTTKGVVKGTAHVVGAVIPDGDDDESKKTEQDEP